MRIAILGTGAVGTALGRALQAAGHDVVHGSRTPRPEDGVVSHEHAVQGAEVVVTALPGQSVIPTLTGVGEANLEGTVILDVSNAFTETFTLQHPGDSVARMIQERVPRAAVVKSLNTMNVAVMVDPQGTAAGSSVFVCGDDAQAKQTVGTLLHDLGWRSQDVIDLGGIAAAAATEHNALLFLALMGALGTPTFNIAVVR